MASAFSTLFSPISSSNTLCFSSKNAFEFPKVFLLHSTNATWQLFIFSKRLYIGLPMETTFVHAALTTNSHFGLAAHFSLNRFGTLLILGSCCPCVVSRIGIWSEYEAERWHTCARGNNSLHSTVAQAWSSLYCTYASPSRPLFQVNRFPINPKSINPQCSSTLLNSCIRCWAFGSLPSPSRPKFHYSPLYTPMDGSV